jgi:hypothetical protein
MGERVGVSWKLCAGKEMEAALWTICAILSSQFLITRWVSSKRKALPVKGPSALQKKSLA